MRIVTLDASGDVRAFKPDADGVLLAVRVIGAAIVDGIGGSYIAPERGSVVVSLSGLSWADAVNGAVASHRDSCVSFGGKLDFPVQVRKGESIYFSAEQQCAIQLWIADPVE